MQRGGEQRTKDDIAKYGCSVMHVFDAEGELPPFAYSIGIQQEAGAPEVVVIGLKRPMAHSVINEYNQRVLRASDLRSGNTTVVSSEALIYASVQCLCRLMTTTSVKTSISMVVETSKSCRSSIRLLKVSGLGPMAPLSHSYSGSLCLRSRSSAVPFNIPAHPPAWGGRWPLR